MLHLKAIPLVLHSITLCQWQNYESFIKEHLLGLPTESLMKISSPFVYSPECQV